MAREPVEMDLNEWDEVALDYVMKMKVMDSLEGPVRIVTDDRPLLEFYLIRMWRTGTRTTHPYGGL